MKKLNLLMLAASLLAQGAMAANIGTLSMEAGAVAQALVAKDGWVEGFIPDNEALDLQAITKSSEPLLMRVTVVKRYQEQGCGRIQIDISQEGVPTKTFTTERFVFPPMQMNLCVSGEPPNDALDVRKATNAAQAASEGLLRPRGVQ